MSLFPPLAVNLIGLRIEIVAVHHDHPELLSEQFKQESLRLEEFGEDHRFSLAGAESLFESAKQCLCLPDTGGLIRQPAQFMQFVDFGFDLGQFLGGKRMTPRLQEFPQVVGWYG
ncbi:hypothetical protein SDC9_144598 [bioreactor metagenome]|uniref:Uncharacterized protein n=1 Tax=bioreactor metagenome TaxID=1076179 RepID=A0A645E7G1_9ZZZZ